MSPTIRARGVFMASRHLSPENDTLLTPKNIARHVNDITLRSSSMV
jgi:hypothetical protein